MKTVIYLFFCALIAQFSLAQSQTTDNQILLRGYPGRIIDKAIEVRVKGQDVDMLVDPFKLKNETWCWQSEFWGKWMLSAVAAYKYKPDTELLGKMNYAVVGLLKTQQKDGYIGNYGPDRQLTGWDIWGRKYSMLGLIRYYEITQDKSALKAAQRIADHLISQVGSGKKDISLTGFYRGMASSSVLEPIIYLYNHTQKEKYFDFATYIVSQWESEHGSKLISKGLADIPVKDRFAPPEKWWSWENGQKAYEMMSCYEGLLEYYKINHHEDHLQAVIKTVDNIIASEINIAGSGSAFECWYGGNQKQTLPAYHTMETCVTMTWMKLCNNLLELTNDPKYGDEIEKTFYNALMASMKYDASDIAKYSPLMGVRHVGEQQCKMDINCCNANGPRGFTLMPDFAIKSVDDELFVNYLSAFSGKINLKSAGTVSIEQITNYPVEKMVNMEINPETSGKFKVNIRIPSWSENTIIKLNGSVLSSVGAGSYYSIDRAWSKGDKISMELDMKGQLHELNGHQAITYGPIVLARDHRFEDGNVDDPIVIQNKEGVVDLQPNPSVPDHIWMSFMVPAKVGTDLEGQSEEAAHLLFCDFASAGNTWGQESRYRIWFVKTLNVMNMKYEKY